MLPTTQQDRLLCDCFISCIQYIKHDTEIAVIFCAHLKLQKYHIRYKFWHMFCAIIVNCNAIECLDKKPPVNATASYY